jgi:hypothetical protein
VASQASVRTAVKVVPVPYPNELGFVELSVHCFIRQSDKLRLKEMEVRHVVEVTNESVAWDNKYACVPRRTQRKIQPIITQP